MSFVRVNKYLSERAGISRREADRCIEKGEVSVNGAVPFLGQLIDPEKDIVEFRGRVIEPEKAERLYYALYKPAGYISSEAKQGKDDRLVTELVDCGRRLFTVGRLDKESEGIILLTDDGDMADRVLRSRNGHEKEYVVGLKHPVGEAVLEAVRAGGLDIGDRRPTGACRVEALSDRKVRMVLTEGMNREIRKIFALFDNEVVSLKRVRFMNIDITGLKPGEYRELTEDERDTLCLLAGTSKEDG